ncbi:MAG: DnaJ domain-containing protein [Patescibacteria group bacterium]|nr:DnaJ domain-containing protein [Patescibacteria group bacterium]
MNNNFPEMNYYQRLGVTENATFEEIKQAYRNAIQKYHPDLHVNSDSENQQKALQAAQYITEAYNTLRNPEKRKIYDQTILIHGNNFPRKQETITQIQKKQSEKIPKEENFYQYKNENQKLSKDIKPVKIAKFPSSRALIAANIIKNLQFLDPNQVITEAMLLTNTTDERYSIIFQKAKKPVRKIDPSGNESIQMQLDAEYEKDLRKYDQILQEKYRTAIEILAEIASESQDYEEKEKEVKQISSKNQNVYKEKQKDSKIRVSLLSGFNEQDSEIVINNPGWIDNNLPGKVNLSKGSTNTEYIPPTTYILKTKIENITPELLLEDRKIRINKATDYLVQSISTGEQGEELQNQLNLNPTETYDKIKKFVESQQFLYFASIYPGAAEKIAKENPKIKEAIRRRDLINQELQKSGLFDSKNNLPLDPSIDAYTGSYEITRKALEKFGESKNYQIPTDSQLTQSVLSVRASDIIELFEKNQEILNTIPQLRNFYEKARKIKGLLPSATQKIGGNIIKRGAAALARNTTFQLAKSTIAKGLASLLVKAGSALATGGLGLIATILPEIINFLKDPVKYIKGIGKILGKTISILIGIFTSLSIILITQILILFSITLAGIIIFVAFVLLVINTSGLVVPKANDLILRRQGINQSENIIIDKSSPVSRIQNPTEEVEVIYTITIITNQNLTNVSFVNTYTILPNRQSNSGPVSQNQPAQILGSPNIPSEIGIGQYVTNYSIRINRSHSNSLVCDTIRLSATIENTNQTQVVSDTHCISVGNAPQVDNCNEIRPIPNPIPTPTGVLMSNNQRYAFPVAPFSGTTEGMSGNACVHWDGFRSTDIFPSGVSSDRSPPARAAVVAYASGRVIWVVGNNRNRRIDPIGGKNLAIESIDQSGRRFYHYYAHFCEIFVSENERVEAGQILGTTDRTGSASRPGSPEHLHFAINRNPARGACFVGGDGDTCPSTDFNNNIERYNRCEGRENQCPGSRIAYAECR